MPPLAKAQETDKEFYSKLLTNSNTIAYKTQIYLSKYNAICFKYSKNNQGKKVCRFYQPLRSLSYTTL